MLISNILVYLDGTEESVNAMQYAVCLAKENKAELTALYVVNTRAIEDLVRSRIFLDSEQVEYTRDLEEDAERYLNHARDLARRKALVLRTEKRSGSVQAEIKKYVRANDIDLLVIGALSRIQSRRDELYNEVERAMRSVDCSVLIARDEDHILDVYEMLN